MTPALEADRLREAFVAISVRLARDTARYQGSPEERAVLARYEAACAGAGRHDDRATAAWVRSFLLGNAGRRDDAEAALLCVRDDREAARAKTAALGPRAGLTGAFPALAERLAGLRAGCAPRLFDAIEWAKGRALADASNEAGWPALGTLRDGLAGGRVHYMTFLLAKEAVFAVLLTADGSALPFRWPLAEAAVTRMAREELIRPGAHGEAQGAASGNIFDVLDDLLDPGPADWRQELAPLATPVAGALADGRMAEGDTLLLSPHRALHLFPLHELAVGARPVGERVAVVRVHGAADVLRRLRAGAPPRPDRYVALRAPRAAEASDPAHAAAFARVVDALGRSMAATAPLDGAQADLRAALAAAAPRRVLHLTAHGDVARGGPPLERSYLSLARDGALPTPTTDPRRPPPGALTAASVMGLLDRGPAPLAGAHVTLQACVSGHARANPQGDAVGLEWAFLLAGAASTLGTHWHVDWPDAARFCEAFYRAWLGDGASRATAWLRAGQALRGTTGDRRWAAYSLTGEWR